MLSSVDTTGKLLFSEENQWRRSGSRGDRQCGRVVLKIGEEEGGERGETVVGMYCLEEKLTNKQTDIHTNKQNLLSPMLSISGF